MRRPTDLIVVGLDGRGCERLEESGVLLRGNDVIGAGGGEREEFVDGLGRWLGCE